MTIDEAKLDEFIGKAVADMSAAFSGPMILIGDRLGLYKAMAGAGPMTPAQLAGATATTERYVREWLGNAAASGYTAYDPEAGTYELTEEAAFCLADPESPVFLPGGYQLMSAMVRDEPHITEAFRTGRGFGWHEHHESLFAGTERFFRPGYNANLVPSWLPALDGVVAKLEAGASVADIGCGHGASTIIMAQAYPRSRFVGFDYHEASIDAARKRATDAGIGDRVSFEVAEAASYPGTDYDLVGFFDSLHDMGDPVAAARHVLESLRRDGTFLLVEPFAGDRVEDNLNPIGRIFYAGSTMICTPASLAQDGGAALGAQAGEARLREGEHVARDGERGAGARDGRRDHGVLEHEIDSGVVTAGRVTSI
jgi:SAM-dependent methyltransferase